jgi:hypothetical protein
VRTGLRVVRFAGTIVLSLANLCAADTAKPKTQAHHKTKKAQQPQLPPLPSGPTGPIQQIPLDSIAPVPPHVTYENGQLTIVAHNSTLADILRAVRKQTGADIDVPDARDRVVTDLGPGPAQLIMARLLNGSRFNYVLLGSAKDPTELTRVVLVARSAADVANANRPPQPDASASQAASADQAQPDTSADTNDADVSQPADDNSNVDQSADQPTADSDQQSQQPGVKTPQELLQEMQERQLQLQQQQNPGLNPRVPQQPPQQQ